MRFQKHDSSCSLIGKKYLNKVYVPVFVKTLAASEACALSNILVITGRYSRLLAELLTAVSDNGEGYREDDGPDNKTLPDR